MYQPRTEAQDNEAARLMQSGMITWPQELKDAMTGKIACMDMICDAVDAYVRKHF